MNDLVPGSSILLVLLLTMVLGISLMNNMRSTIYMLDIARKREQFEEQYYAAQGLLNFGITYAIKQNIKQSSDPFVINIDQWPPYNENNYQGKLKITKIKTKTGLALHLESLLVQNEISVCILSCRLSKQKNNILFNGREEEWFVISNFQHGFFSV